MFVQSRRDSNLETSPNDPESFIQPELFITSDDRDILGQGLSDDLAVKGIWVAMWQTEKLVGVIPGVSQDSRIQIVQPSLQIRLGEVQLSL